MRLTLANSNIRELSLSVPRTQQILMMSSDYAHVSPIAYPSPEDQALDPVAHTGNQSSTGQRTRWCDALLSLIYKWRRDDITASVLWHYVNHTTMQYILYPEALHTAYIATSMTLRHGRCRAPRVSRCRWFGNAKLRFLSPRTGTRTGIVLVERFSERDSERSLLSYWLLDKSLILRKGSLYIIPKLEEWAYLLFCSNLWRVGRRSLGPSERACHGGRRLGKCSGCG
jgi:hypothetical protein